MKAVSLLIKPASSLCNLRCVYCFYADLASARSVPSYGRMDPETAERLLRSVRAELSPGDRLSIAFQGGEPTLAGIDFFRGFFQLADRLLAGIPIRWSLQTNGILLDSAWCELLRARKVLVGLSVDGPAAIHNAQRPDAAGKGSYAAVHRAMALLRRENISFNVLTVLSAEAARHPAKLWNWVCQEQIAYIQFIPCLDALEADSPSGSAITPSRFRDFYLQLFPLWKTSMEQGTCISVKLFDDLINLYLAGQASACGITGNCAVQYVVEANGDVFPCDFYALDRFRLGNLTEDSLSALAAQAGAFLTDGRAFAETAPCRGCRYELQCGGGCKRMHAAVYVEEGVCRYAELLDRLLPQLLPFAQRWLDRHGRR